MTTTDETCRRCKAARATISAYWGHPLCAPCATRTATELDQRDQWPAVPWTTDDEELIS